DLMTIRENFHRLKGLKVVYMGDGRNNVCLSLMMGCAKAGAHFVNCTPRELKPARACLDDVCAVACRNACTVTVEPEPSKAVVGAQVIYTDVWVSMGQEEEKEKRLAAFKKYQVNEKLLSASRKNPFVMHPMPVHHGEELESSLVYGPRSILLDQAENRLHIQKAVLFYFMGAAGSEAL
ncbi:MAG: ornithine carbamoyltransferase, partial [Dehalococcoidia bacterium]|nr:ornithine carbamoyltransferase [Dehalococcoidia bacterium]